MLQMQWIYGRIVFHSKVPNNEWQHTCSQLINRRFDYLLRMHRAGAVQWAIHRIMHGRSLCHHMLTAHFLYSRRANAIKLQFCDVEIIQSHMKCVCVCKIVAGQINEHQYCCSLQLLYKLNSNSNMSPVHRNYSGLEWTEFKWRWLSERERVVKMRKMHSKMHVTRDNSMVDVNKYTWNVHWFSQNFKDYKWIWNSTLKMDINSELVRMFKSLWTQK